MNLEIQVIYYKKEDGHCPFVEWFDHLQDKQTKAKIQVKIRRVAVGNFGHCKPVGQGVSELKIDFGPGYRVYFGQKGKELVVLLSGGDKSSQSKDIQKAREYWKNYRRRYDP